MNIIFFEPNIKGHRIEYIHHEVSYASKHPGNFYYFLIPKVFDDVKELFDWPASDNINYVFLADNESHDCTHKRRLKRALSISLVIRHYSLKLKADFVFLNSLKDGMPFLPFVIPSKTKIAGIIYDIFLWRLDEIKPSHLYFNKMCFWLFAHSETINKVLLLNDSITTKNLNDKYKFSKYVYLPDPITEIDDIKLRNVREQYQISYDNIVYLQFPISKRKHSLDILRAIDRMRVEDLVNRTFIFAGEVDSQIEKEFMSKVNELSSKSQIIVIKGFVSYEDLYNLCFSSDIFLTLYDNHYMSSGVIGYAAFFHKFLISTGKGLLGNLVKTYHMGECIDSISINNIMSALSMKPEIINSEYASDHTIGDFTRTIFLTFDNDNTLS